MKKISAVTAIATIHDYYGQNFPLLRLGQFLVNDLELRTDDPEDTRELFYTKSDKLAISILFERFVAD